ncbi:response regulator [Thiomicrorhabdus sp. ZW0627]|uniref:response regulator n=1 Tax=Thiomicrorhabdus sp. ZW0627 TaxID=3039774 RepID=UPI00243731B2|nr:response regulator [Thiomicrorhabdus sp. ZW0627]MDG6774482.1 response regulator [Thiomicrorhabdus sp. ZW0627]
MLPTQTANQKRHRLLLVDDDPTNLALMCAYFDSTNYEIVTATDGVMAKQIILDHPYDYFSAYVFDYRMPFKDGITLLIELKNDIHYRLVPAILQTSADSHEDIQRGIQAGAFYYLLKPFSKAHLLSIVDAAVKGFSNHLEITRQAVSLSEALNLLQDAHFTFKTIDQAKHLSNILAFLTRDPQKIGIGLFELMLNAIEHGNLGIGYEEKTKLIENDQWQAEIARRASLPENKKKFVNVEVEHHTNHLDITIEDMGKGFDYQPFMDFSIDRAMDNHGRGIMMANKLSFDRLEFSKNGSRVTCTVQLN